MKVLAVKMKIPLRRMGAQYKTSVVANGLHITRGHGACYNKAETAIHSTAAISINYLKFFLPFKDMKF